ncbi:MAG: hypothetical protein FWC91_07095 [Defluviitaleaceae bacterium]|nr:hypothetical protein [Defluviitaleaceae bacterium]
MMNTAFGLLTFTINGKPFEITPTEISNKYKHFQVDKRYQVDLSAVRQIGEETVIVCQVFPSDSCGFGSSTGEGLSQVTFESTGKKMCIGTIGDLPNITYKYSDYSIQLTISKESEYTSFVFIIAWCNSPLADTDSAVFLADPIYQFCG